MTISSTVVRTLYDGDGSTTSFSSVFIFWASSDPRVILVSSSGGETVYVEGTHYSVTGGGGATGTIEISSSIPPSAVQSLLIKSNVPLTQETDLTVGGAFATQDVEDEIDRDVRRIQQLSETLDRSVKLTEASTFTDLTLPEPVANRVLGWDSSADGTLVNIVRNSSEFITLPLSLADGGTASTSSSAALTTLGAQPLDSDLTAIAALTHADGTFIVSDGSSWVAEASSVALNSLTASSSDGDFLVHNGTNWVSEASSVARASIGLATVSSSEAEAGTGTTERGWTPALIKQSIDALGGGSFTFIGSAVASASASLTVTGLTGKPCIIVGESLLPATDSVEAWLRLGDTSGVDSAASDYAWKNSGDNIDSTTGAETYEQDNADSEILIAPTLGGADIGNAATEGISFTAFMPNPQGTNNPSVFGMFWGENSNPTNTGIAGDFHGSRLSTITTDRVNFQFSSGNVATGTLYVYELATS